MSTHHNSYCFQHHSQPLPNIMVESIELKVQKQIFEGKILNIEY